MSTVDYRAQRKTVSDALIPAHITTRASNPFREGGREGRREGGEEEGRGGGLPQALLVESNLPTPTQHINGSINYDIITIYYL